jgi:hypothetical protein
MCGGEALQPKAPQQEVHRIEDIELHRPSGNLIQSGLHLDTRLSDSGGSFLLNNIEINIEYIDKEYSC